MKTIYAFGIFAAMIFALGFGYGSLFHQAQATGCPVDTIIPMLDEAIKSLEAGDTQTGLSQLKDATNEIKDTFEVE